MLLVHELRVKVVGDELQTFFYQHTRAGKKLVGACVADAKDRDAVRDAIVQEHQAVLTGTGKRRM